VINSNSATYVPLQLTPSNSTTILTPTALNILANGNFLYVSAYNAASKTGYLFGYSVGSTGGLTPLNGGIPVVVGSQPVALISDSGSQTLYIVDEAKNQISSFAVQSSGALSLIGTTATGDQPTSVALFKDTFLYVANSLDSTVTAYSASAGNLTQLGNYASGIDPIAVTVDPRNIGFLYTVNFLGNSISGYQINASTGALINAQRSPFLSSVQPTAISGIPHGGNSTSTSSSGSGN
jgi:6-phosphogluconolactonase (cycloisomerase 2 family)